MTDPLASGLMLTQSELWRQALQVASSVLRIANCCIAVIHQVLSLGYYIHHVCPTLTACWCSLKTNVCTDCVAITVFRQDSEWWYAVWSVCQRVLGLPLTGTKVPQICGGQKEQLFGQG